jgi:hypothetical protein
MRELVAYEAADDRTQSEGACCEQDGRPLARSGPGKRLRRHGRRLRLVEKSGLWHLRPRTIARAVLDGVGKSTARELGELRVDEHELRTDRTEVILAPGRTCRKRPDRVSTHPHGSSLAGAPALQGRTELLALCGTYRAIYNDEMEESSDGCGKTPRDAVKRRAKAR